MCSPAGPHIQAHQPHPRLLPGTPLARLDAPRWPHLQAPQPPLSPISPSLSPAGAHLSARLETPMPPHVQAPQPSLLPGPTGGPPWGGGAGAAADIDRGQRDGGAAAGEWGARWPAWKPSHPLTSRRANTPPARCVISHGLARLETDPSAHIQARQHPPPLSLTGRLHSYAPFIQRAAHFLPILCTPASSDPYPCRWVRSCAGRRAWRARAWPSCGRRRVGPGPPVRAYVRVCAPLGGYESAWPFTCPSRRLPSLSGATTD